MVGFTDLPRSNLTLSQCKRDCFKDSKCEAILYDEQLSQCEMRSLALFKTCDAPSPNLQAFIESFEHYYEPPRFSFIGSITIHTTSIDLNPDCQKLCDAFLNCEAIHYDETTSINNCKLLGGDVVRLGLNETAEGILVARDVTLFTKGFLPDSNNISTFSVFDVDECKALCEDHSECGSMVFGNRSCTLYPRSGFSSVDEDVSLATPHFVDFKAFVDIEQDFVEAKGLCLDLIEGTTPLSSRMTTQSSHDCAARCNEDFDCRLFTYNEVTSSDCKLYGDGVNLKDACSGNFATTFVMYTRGRFTESEDACLKDEARTNETILLPTRKNIVECAALCDSWFNCRSFRIDQDMGECRLYEQEQYSKDHCTGSEPSGDLYVYFSDFFFVRLTDAFCVASNSIIGEILEDVPLEACKTICGKNVLCVALKHNQNGDCAIYSSSDFSLPCNKNNERTLYIRSVLLAPFHLTDLIVASF